MNRLKSVHFLLERVTGVEPVLSDWQPDVMPLYDTRNFLIRRLAIRPFG